MCDALGVSRQGYDQWKNREDDGEADKVILDEILLIMKKARYTYGLLRFTAALKERGFRVNKKRVDRIMKENNIRSKRVKKRVFANFWPVKSGFDFSHFKLAC